MPIDTSNLPISGGLIVAGLVYAGVVTFGLAPMVAKRTIESSNWTPICEAGLKAEISERRSPPRFIPKTDCKSIFGSLMPELDTLCSKYGNPDFGGPATQMMQAQERAKQEFENRRLRRIAGKTTSRCECASAIVSEKRAWTIYSGSFRLITPQSVSNNLNNSLVRALRSPQCSMKG